MANYDALSQRGQEWRSYDSVGYERKDRAT
jgi:hypothetical protein